MNQLEALKAEFNAHVEHSLALIERLRAALLEVAR